jgi:hypothetical protein
MIYAIQQRGRTIALTNNKSDLLRFTDPDFETRWATPNEAARYRNLHAAEQRKWWPILRRRFVVALWWLFATSFPPTCR